MMNKVIFSFMALGANAAKVQSVLCDEACAEEYMDRYTEALRPLAHDIGTIDFLESESHIVFHICDPFRSSESNNRFMHPVCQDFISNIENYV
jgi:hypothetical protein